ncbi:MAG: Chromosome segregation ATPase [Sporanaerobacter sp.]|jgi:hypothetical protein|uniref:hypothetical protein n=1 Tax=Sporanaerobacter sp. TaxID=2010183 RepID=UPI003A1030BD
MPRISKIRLVGCKYDGFKKEHENSIFDLTKDGSPDHTLFTLKNGGGKGVMMQLIFQIMLPETRWGKNNGNKISSMFYDQKGRLNPYTFHVLLEWKLDTNREKYLITGICMKAYRKNVGKNEDDDEKIGLNYFLYTYEHENNGFYTLENIPVYDRDNEKAVEMEVFEKFIEDNRRDFVKYSQSSAKRLDSNFYEYMKRWGIYRSEWEILKVINKVEGGVGDYFQKATDNKAIFDNLILPAISENMKNYEYEGDGLKEMFKSNLYITRNLPILLKREGDFRELSIAINPLIRNAEIGSKFLDIKERCIADGNDLYFILKDEEKNAEKNIEKWESEIIKSKEKQEELLFQRENLEYAEVNREIEKIEEKNKVLDVSIAEAKEKIADEKHLEKLYEINKILTEVNEIELLLKEKTAERQRLIDSLELDDTKKRLEELDLEIKDKWEGLKVKWEDVSNKYYGYDNYLNREIENIYTQKSKMKEVEKGIEIEINKFSLRKEENQREYGRLSNIFDPFSMSFPEKLLDDIKSRCENEMKKVERLEIEIEEKRKNKNQLEIEKNKIEIEKKNEKGKIKELKKEFDIVEKIEMDLKKRICWELGIDDVKEDISSSWIDEKLYSLELVLSEKENKIEEFKKNLWESNIDKSLNKDREYWIPNKDILDLKERIISVGINVQTGMEFLNGMKKEEIQEILKANPSFIYGLVIGNEEDWKIIEKTIDRDFLVRNLVPIYLRTNMGNHEKEFNTVDNKGFDFIYSEKYIEWIDNIDREYNSIEEIIDSFKERVGEINNLIGDIKNWKFGKNSIEIQSEIDNHKSLSEELERKEGKLKVQLYEEEKLISTMTSEFKNSKNEVEKYKDNLAELKKYVEANAIVLKEEKIYNENLEKLEDVRQKIKSAEKDMEFKKSMRESNNLEYEKWKIEIENKLESIKKAIPEAKVCFNQIKDLEIASMPIYEIWEGDIFVDLRERSALAEDIEKRNGEIKFIQKDIDHFLEKIEVRRKDLEKIDVLWEKYESLKLSLNEIVIRLEEVKKNLKAHEYEYNSLKSEKDRLVGSLEEKQKNFIKLGKRIQKNFGRAPQIWADLDLLEKSMYIEKEYKENKEYLVQAEKILEERKKYKNQIREFILQLDGYKEIDFHKGKINKILKEKFINNSQIEVEEWIRRYKKSEDDLSREIEKGEEYLKTFKEIVETKVYDEVLKARILNEMQKVGISKFKANLESFGSMKNYFQIELNTLSSDKEKAEQARNQWTTRASKRVLKIVESLREMVSGMVYINENEYSFPLVKLKGEERLPKEEEDVLFLLKEYFVEAIEKVFSENENIEDIDDKKLEEIMSDKVIFSKALQGRYPILMVYKMTEKNEFKYKKPRDYYYTTWEAINKGEGDMPEGSGGQTLSINTFVIMMLMNYKKRHIGNENPWTVLVLDNPFGKASAKHILDPVFEIADKLNFQIIAFAAPEIIKVEISERFPVFWELRIGHDEKEGLITGKVMHGGRKM